MACNSGRDSTTMGRYGEGSGNYRANDRGGACETGCFNENGDNQAGNTCSGCSGKECVNGCGECSLDCGPGRSCSGCTGECSGCSGECGGCSDSCSGCRETCTGGCNGTCTTACAQQCSGTCSGGCVGDCNYGCASEEVEELYRNLHLSRIAESNDINTIKKIIYRLFENFKKSTIYNNKSYQNESGNDSDAGLMDNWNVDADGNMTFSLLLNKTFKSIIENLNNLNNERIIIDQDKMNPIQIWEIPDPIDNNKTIKLSTVDRDAALYWIECLKKIYELVAPKK